MRTIRIVLAGMPPMLEDLISSAIAPERDMVIARRLSAAHAVRSIPSSSRIDVVIVREPAELAGADDTNYLGALRFPKIIAISHDGIHGSLHELRPRRAPLGEMSADSLVAAIRSAAVSQCAPPIFAGEG